MFQTDWLVFIVWDWLSLVVTVYVLLFYRLLFNKCVVCVLLFNRWLFYRYIVCISLFYKCIVCVCVIVLQIIVIHNIIILQVYCMCVIVLKVIVLQVYCMCVIVLQVYCAIVLQGYYCTGMLYVFDCFTGCCYRYTVCVSLFCRLLFSKYIVCV